MSQQNKNEWEQENIRTDFEDFDVTFKHDDESNDDFSEVIIEGRGTVRSSQGEYLENVVLASGMASLQSERFRSKTRSDRAAQKALKELEEQSLKTLKNEGEPERVEQTVPDKAKEPAAEGEGEAETSASENSAGEETLTAVSAAATVAQEEKNRSPLQWMKETKTPIRGATAILPNPNPNLSEDGANSKSGRGALFCSC